MTIRPRIIRTSSADPSAEAIDTAASVIKGGGIVAYPTRCLYGLGTDALNDGAVAEIFAIKQRPAQKPVLILIDGIRQLERLVIRIPKIAEEIMRQFWPGNVTLVFEASEEVSPVLTGGSRKIGIRLPGHPIASALVKAVSGAITGTSANLSGSRGCHQVRDLEPTVAQRLDLILDAGPLEGGQGSTVVDVTGGAPRILREGVVSKRAILAIGGKN